MNNKTIPLIVIVCSILATFNYCVRNNTEVALGNIIGMFIVVAIILITKIVIKITSRNNIHDKDI